MDVSFFEYETGSDWRDEMERMKALAKITDQEELKEIVIIGGWWKVCREAWDSIVDFDQAFLKRVVIHLTDRYYDYNNDLCREAWSKISDFDQEFLKEAVNSVYDKNICLEAWKRITDFDREFLQKTAKEACNEYVRCAALCWIDDYDIEQELKEETNQGVYFSEEDRAKVTDSDVYFFKRLALYASQKTIRKNARRWLKKMNIPL